MSIIRLPGIGEDANYAFSISLLPTTPELPKMRKRDRDRAEALRLAGSPSVKWRSPVHEGWCERAISRISAFPVVT